MNFSELIPFSGGSRLSSFSPSGFYMAEAAQFRVRVRDSRSLQVLHQFTCADQISDLIWSPDSLFLLCSMRKRSLIQVWSIEHPDWQCKIDEGVAGLVSACWTPDSRHIMTTADFHLRITLWSLTDKSVSYLKNPKPCSRGIDFSSDGCLLALAERRNLKDCISIFDCCNWRLIAHFQTPTDDLDGVAWAPDATALACWESSLSSCILIYRSDGTLLHKYIPHSVERSLGTKCCSWSPSSQFLGIGGYDGCLKLLNNISWQPLTELKAAQIIDATATIVYKETMATSGLIRYEAIADGCITIPSIKPDAGKPNPRIGIGAFQFSSCSRYVAFREDSQPGALWIQDLSKLHTAALLLHKNAIRSFAWDPNISSPRLAAVTANQCLYIWSPNGCIAATVPTNSNDNTHHSSPFLITSVAWHPNSDALLLTSDADACVCFLDSNDDDKENV